MIPMIPRRGTIQSMLLLKRAGHMQVLNAMSHPILHRELVPFLTSNLLSNAWP